MGNHWTFWAREGGHELVLFWRRVILIKWRIREVGRREASGSLVTLSWWRGRQPPWNREVQADWRGMEEGLITCVHSGKGYIKSDLGKWMDLWGGNSGGGLGGTRERSSGVSWSKFPWSRFWLWKPLSTHLFSLPLASLLESTGCLLQKRLTGGIVDGRWPGSGEGAWHNYVLLFALKL